MDAILNFLSDNSYDFIMTVIDFLTGVCPFDSVRIALDGCATGLGWLNWLIPIGQTLTILNAVVAILLILYVVNFATSFFNK